MDDGDEDWYFGHAERCVAERYLFQNCNISGSFLIRASNNDIGNYALSVKNFDETRQTFIISHHKIKSEGGRFRWDRSLYNGLGDVLNIAKKTLKLSNVCLVTR